MLRPLNICLLLVFAIATYAETDEEWRDRVMSEIRTLQASNDALMATLTSMKRERSVERPVPPVSLPRRLSESADPLASAELKMCPPNTDTNNGCPTLLATSTDSTSNLTITVAAGSLNIGSMMGTHVLGTLHTNDLTIEGQPLGGLTLSGAEGCSTSNMITLNIGGLGSIELPTSC